MLFWSVDPVKSSRWQCNSHSSTKIPEISVKLRKCPNFCWRIMVTLQQWNFHKKPSWVSLWLKWMSVIGHVKWSYCTRFWTGAYLRLIESWYDRTMTMKRCYDDDAMVRSYDEDCTMVTSCLCHHNCVQSPSCLRNIVSLPSYHRIITIVPSHPCYRNIVSL